MDNYIAMHYKGKEWAIYGKGCECFIVFGNKKEIQECAKRLNKKDKGE